MLTFEHANSRYTGTQLLVDMVPAKGVEDGKFTFSIRPQLKDGNPVPPVGGHYEFSDEGEVFATLTVKQVAHMLLVFNGKAESILGGKGVCDRNDEYTSIFHFDHQRPEKGKPNSYSIHIITKMMKSEDRRELRIQLNPTEALSLALSIKAAMGLVAFGE